MPMMNSLLLLTEEGLEEVEEVVAEEAEDTVAAAAAAVDIRLEGGITEAVDLVMALPPRGCGPQHRSQCPFRCLFQFTIHSFTHPSRPTTPVLLGTGRAAGPFRLALCS